MIDATAAPFTFRYFDGVDGDYWTCDQWFVGGIPVPKTWAFEEHRWRGTMLERRCCATLNPMQAKMCRRCGMHRDYPLGVPHS